MEISALHQQPHHFLRNPLLFPYQLIPPNYVHWTQTPECHIYSADLPGVRKEEIKVEVVDSRYLIVRTEAVEESGKPARSFMKKFRLPGTVDIDGIMAGYEDGVLTVMVPRLITGRGFFIDPADVPVPESLEVLARAA